MFPFRGWWPLTATDSSSFRVFFQSACDVPELEEKFNIDEYSDMVTLSKPVIYISIEEIINTHSVKPNTNIHSTLFPEQMMIFDVSQWFTVTN